MKNLIFSLRNYTHSVIVIFLGFILSGIVTLFYQHHLSEEQRLNFSWSAHDYFQAIHHELEEILHSIRDVSSFYAGSVFVDRNEFNEFTRPILNRREGIQALGWIPLVHEPLRQQFETEAKNKAKGQALC